MKRTSVKFIIILSFLGLLQCTASGQLLQKENPDDIISLAGIWKFKADPFYTGISSNGVQLLPQLPEQITLPGSTDKAGKGYRVQGMSSLRLTRPFEYKGAAWYEKDIFIPTEWTNKYIRLFLERAHWQTEVWINGKAAGKNESLSVPHIYDISSLIKPGQNNSIRIRVDNSLIHDIGYSHAISAETQTNWNGIIGKIQLQAFDKIHIHTIQVYTKASQGIARVHITILNNEKAAVKGKLLLRCCGPDQQKTPITAGFSGNDSMISVTADVPLGDSINWWDEFHPALYSIGVQMAAQAGEDHYEDNRTATFGIREITANGTRFQINGRETFIRSTVNCAEFPLTGYPAMDLDSWVHIFRTCRDYGLNAMRFHSWCPPEAAFDAADSLGVYLQVENSDWRFTVGEDSATNDFLQKESARILEAYGNHPSFVFFCEGNELVGPGVRSFLSGLVNQWKKADPRHLYTGSSGYPVIPENDFEDFYGARPQHWKEGLKGRFNAEPLQTLYDYSAYVQKFKVPMITHEVGQWCVYPDFDEIPKFTGVLKPFNYQLFRELLRNHDMLGQAGQFTLASGKFQVIQKKEEIESYLRTPGLGGYTLLQLNDYPGQGTAPVGVVDVFWHPKSYTAGKEFREFQSARVPLLRTSTFTWTNDQSFKAVIDLANFGESAIKNAVLHWTLQYPDGKIYAEGDFKKASIPVGSPINIGELTVPLNRITDATRLSITVAIQGTDCSNHWNIWVYPAKLPPVDGKGVFIASQWDARAKARLEKGGKVLLLADTASVAMAADPVFSGISWNTVWSGMPPNLLGILCDPQHPALRNFPTEFHSNWQWWDIVRHSKPFILDSTPATFRPLVQMIPDWNNPRKIGLVFEAKVGKGSLLVCGADLSGSMKERPVAKQLLYSLRKYVSSKDFAPQQQLSMEVIDELFKKSP